MQVHDGERVPTPNMCIVSCCDRGTVQKCSASVPEVSEPVLVVASCFASRFPPGQVVSVRRLQSMFGGKAVFIGHIIAAGRQS